MDTDPSKEEQVLAFVKLHATRGNAESVLTAIDAFCAKNWMMNVGPEKGQIVVDALREASPKSVFELGTYCGYSSILMSRWLPDGGQIYSFEVNARVAAIAQEMIEFAGASDKIRILLGTVQDRHQDTGVSSADFVFLDHIKDGYLPDLLFMRDSGILEKGTVVVADNVKYPGAPDFHAEVTREDGDFDTVSHDTRLEYSEIEDIVTVSHYKGRAT